MKTLALAAFGLSLLTACATVPQAPLVPPASLAGPDFLARNGAAHGVVTTASGLEYFIVASGPKAGRSPAGHDVVSFSGRPKAGNCPR